MSEHRVHAVSTEFRRGCLISPGTGITEDSEPSVVAGVGVNPVPL